MRVPHGKFCLNRQLSGIYPHIWNVGFWVEFRMDQDGGDSRSYESTTITENLRDSSINLMLIGSSLSKNTVGILKQSSLNLGL
jgi:hypothetical protein